MCEPLRLLRGTTDLHQILCEGPLSKRPAFFYGGGGGELAQPTTPYGGRSPPYEVWLQCQRRWAEAAPTYGGWCPSYEVVQSLRGGGGGTQHFFPRRRQTYTRTPHCTGVSCSSNTTPNQKISSLKKLQKYMFVRAFLIIKKNNLCAIQMLVNCLPKNLWWFQLQIKFHSFTEKKIMI